MKILVALDHSEVSQLVLAEVAARSWPPHSSAEVLNVAEIGHAWSDSETSQRVVARSAELVNQGVETLRARGIDASGLTRQGDPKRVILDRAAETKADFIFVGSHGASALKRLLMGSVAAAVASHASCSVAIVRAPAKAAAGVRRILLATDGSEFSERAARSIAERPWPPGTGIEVFSVVELHLGTTQALFEPPFVDTDQLELQRAEGMKRAQNAVASAVEILRDRFPEVSDSVSVLLGGPKNVIIDEAKKTGADLLVVGSHGHSGIERFLLGSVSQGLALEAPCTVEVIR